MLTPGNLPYAELVYHVLAHVESAPELAAGTYNPTYVSYCGAHLGSTAERTLGEDARALSALLSDHEKLARVQVLAWLYETVEASGATEALEFSRVTEADGAREPALQYLREAPSVELELLRCAVALEREHWERLPHVCSGRVVSPGALQEQEARISALEAVAPYLCQVQVQGIFPLSYRGRAFADSVLVGVPGRGAGMPSLQHVGLQAAHEATVLEVQQRVALPFLELERAALTLLKTRVRGSQFEDEHSNWLQRLDLGPFGGSEGLHLSALSPKAREVLLVLQGGNS